ncbi:MAG: N-acetyltransferase [Flavobacteriaceae bacterium]|nr:N-acetyltransferase [Flavobacteriaceae bacterium]
MINLQALVPSDWEAVSRIYKEGIATKMATFETEVPSWEEWDKKYIDSCRLVAQLDDQVVGFAVLSKVSDRFVYRGVAEVSVYVSESFRGQGIGESLLKKLITESEANGFWSLQAGIFSENKASIELHKKCGFRNIGIKERIGQLDGKWYNNHFLERRSKTVGN